MRLGAIDFVSKPVTPEMLRKVVAKVLSRNAAAPETTHPAPARATAVKPSEDRLARAKQALNRREFDHAEELLHQAITSNNYPLAEAHYLMEILHEMRDDQNAAYSSYRAALRIDPRYETSKLHLLTYINDSMM
jgi:two-component SAPR family response regulator